MPTIIEVPSALIADAKRLADYANAFGVDLADDLGKAEAPKAAPAQCSVSGSALSIPMALFGVVEDGLETWPLSPELCGMVREALKAE